MIAVATVLRAVVRLAPILVLLLLPAGCVSQPLVQLRPQPYNPLTERLKLSARGGPKPSGQTRLFLRRHDLPDKIGRNPRRLLDSLAEVHRKSPSRDSAYALAELSYIAAKKLETFNPRAAMELYFNSVAQAYSYLFDPRFGNNVNPYDPRFRGACELYNSALESCLRIVRKRGYFRPGEKFSFTIAGRQLNVSVESHGSNWRAEDFDSFEFVSDYELTGLTNLNHTYGLGVPLIAVRKAGASSPRIERYYAPGLSFPITAFLRLEPDTDDRDGAVTLRLELYDSLESTTVRVAGRRVPLETDISTPLAYFLDRPAFRHLDTFGLLRPDRAARIAGLYMIQPYQPGKIPVVMIHGLWSSPMTWIEALNDLQSVPEIRDNFQFWFYLYPTGEPFWKTAAKLRDDLDRVDDVFGASAYGPALRSKVLIGHSMGGLLARLMTFDSRDRFWDSVSKTPLADIDADWETKEELKQVFFFQPNRTVARVVTIASPFRGSEISNSFTRWLGRQLISLPRRTMAATRQLLDRNPGTFRRHDFLDGTTSLDSLSPQSPFLRVMQLVPLPDDVQYHNIVGVTDDVPLAENGDGIVPYRSAHLDDVASEIIVPAGHSAIQRHPRTILEIRRILLEHLADYNRGGATGIVPVSAQSGLDNRRGHGGFGRPALRSATGHSRPRRLRTHDAMTSSFNP